VKCSRSLWFVRLAKEPATTTAGEDSDEDQNYDLSRKDWELCRTYVQKMEQKGLSVISML
jgi:hypothetical protein